MDIKSLVRDAERVKSHLVELPDGKVVTTKGCKIYIPVRFVDRQLAYISTECNIVGIYAIVVDDKYYGVSTINAMINIDPSSISRIKIEDEPYFEFTFNPGSTVFKSTQLIKTDILVYKIYDEIISNGHVPWYLSYKDLGGIFDTAQYHANANIGTNKEVTELIASLIARDATDRTKYYRTVIANATHGEVSEPVFIGLRNVTYSATNTTNRLGGSYFETGVVASLVNQSTREERVESILLA